MPAPRLSRQSRIPLIWGANDLGTLAGATIAYAPLIKLNDSAAASAEIDIWDAWPLATLSGQPVAWNGGEIWFALVAEKFNDPEDRHSAARIHHFHRRGGIFHHLGRTFDEGLSPGSREWSGSAVLSGDEVTLYFTAAGQRGEVQTSFLQRLFMSKARLQPSIATPFGAWSMPRELLQPGCGPYQVTNGTEGRTGEIKAFRDPFPWKASDGTEFLLFTASSAVNPGAFNGLVGLAAKDATGQYQPLPPLIDASGVNNELERAHIVEWGAQLYLFWSTQAKVFAPGIGAPTGLYGATAASMDGPWRLLNGHGLVFANPEQQPRQAYSWWVMPDLNVTSFIDYPVPGDQSLETGAQRRQNFGGTFAPMLKLRLDGASASLQTRAS